MIAENYENVLFALAVWREARNQPREAQLGVAWVIRNRVGHPQFRSSIVSVILQPYQFSSFNASGVFPNPLSSADWAAWLQCCGVVESSDPDPTGGASHYFDVSINPPDWADPNKQTASLGKFRFYKLI